MGLRLHNTLTKRVEELVTREAGKAAIYVCGPTVYDVTHLGHMRAAVVFDVLRRYLEFRGYQVMHVQNVTDVEDKIIARAQAEGVPTDAITVRYLEDYRQASRALNVMPPHVEPHASQHIPEMIEMIKKLVEGGYAYDAEGDVYFDVSRLPQYGKLSGQLPGELRAGARVEPGEHKRHPADFAVWKHAKPGEPNWDSPWGRGRPGWHIECSAMSLKYLGMGFDIHGGGDDLIFPHHENEIAQSEAYAATQPFARYWVHNAMVMVRGEKMSKSLHNYIAVADALGRFPADVIRYALAAVHYRKPMEVDEARLQDAAKAVDRLRIALA
ncbi:MAG: cysteine--tRNA ligase, partial [Armatimonadetes bacterium 13_1_40CM_3_65_7]